jgi:hypothetical protein
MIDIESAAQLIDFGGRISPDIAAGQLEGAVAVHNILEYEGVAYLADEVGMGKTLVALGVLALFRHWSPDFRALIIAPRENIQRKWGREFRQFTRNNIRFRDLRVRALHDAPARALVHCTSLPDLLHETILDPDRDFFARMTSFSLPFGQVEAMRGRRDELLRMLPWVDRALLDLRSKDTFKQNVARAICCGLPVFDLVIVDEAHNLKHGFASGAMRNRVMGTVLGRDNEVPIREFPEYGVRAKRVLMLSATPVEDDYRQLWNQLDVFGKAHGFNVLADRDAPAEEKRECARRILIRRITSLHAAGKPLTKNLYRREWRYGGVDEHDDPLRVPDDRRRLIVALVQKKVSEALRSPRFNNQFQIGMLASFESFMETAGVARTLDGDQDASNFDQSEQSTDEVERRGADVDVLNRLARSYRKKFDGELPHPKMDAVVDGLTQSFDTGEKALVFVRRVASVRELKRKLDERHDEHVLKRLRAELPDAVLADLEPLVARYREERRKSIDRREDQASRSARADAEDRGGRDTFFAWFFRGLGPPGLFSGAALQRRFGQASTTLSTFFEDNWVAWLLGVGPESVLEELSAYLHAESAALQQRMEEDLRTWLMEPGRPAERRWFFLGYQRAALRLLAAHPGPVQHAASVVLDQRFRDPDSHARWSGNVSSAQDWLVMSTFFTELRSHPTLSLVLPIDAQPISKSLDGNFVELFRQREVRREMIAAMCRLGHPIIDLYVLQAKRLSTLKVGARAEGESERVLIDAFLARLDEQSASTERLTTYCELRNALDHSDLILDLNLPDARTVPLDELSVLFGRLLREQQPVGGMSGRVNETLVRQFRMPGFPLVLISTDLLQEGEDLHSFCSAVYHYGISWMPSSMEQRIGRVDRVNSATQRRLGSLTADPDGSKLLQVYYPHLRDTVEVLQVDRVLRRMSDFIRMMHEDLVRDQREEKRIDINTEILKPRASADIPSVILKTAFPVTEAMLRGPSCPLAVDAATAAALRDRFMNLPELLDSPDLEWHDTAEEGSLIGVLALEARRQPFTLLLRSAGGRQFVRCISPIGRATDEERVWLLDVGTRVPLARATSRGPHQDDSYNLAVEGDMLLGDPAVDGIRIRSLIDHVAGEADQTEEELWGQDALPGETMNQLSTELHGER